MSSNGRLMESCAEDVSLRNFSLWRELSPGAVADFSRRLIGFTAQALICALKFGGILISLPSTVVAPAKTPVETGRPRSQEIISESRTSSQM